MSRSRHPSAGFPNILTLALVLLTGAGALASGTAAAAEPEAAGTAPITLSPHPATRAVAVSAVFMGAPANVSGGAGDTIRIDAYASGDPSAILTITATGVPAGLAFETNTPISVGATASLTGTTTEGAYYIDWRAEDQYGNFDTAQTLLVVVAPDGPPVLAPLSPMTLYENAIEYQNLTATDPDLDMLTFSLAGGPSFVSVVTDNQGAGTAFGRAIVAPGLTDQGSYTVTVRVSDGASVDTGSFSLTVLNVTQNLSSPYFSPYPSSMTVNEGATADQTLRAFDADGNALTFLKSGGPSFMTVTTTDPGTGTATGNVRLAPGPTDEGNYYGDLYVTDGLYYGFGSFSITVVNVPAPPVPGAPYWEVVGPFYDPRTGGPISAAAASLIGDKLYVSHGSRYFETSYLSAFDIGLSAWTHGGPALPNAADERTALAGATARGRHYAVGGRGADATNMEEFDPVAARWTTKAPLPVPRAGLGVASWNDKIYVVGGRSGYYYGDGTIYNRLDIYDPATNQWTNRAGMPVAVAENGATVAYMGKIYVFGGYNGSANVATTQIYDIATNSWRLGAPMPTARGAAVAGVIGDRIAVFGGYSGGSRYLSLTEMYNPATDTWSLGNEMPEPVYDLCPGPTFDHRGIYAVGGRTSTSSAVLMVLRPIIGLSLPFALQSDENQAISFQVSGTHHEGLPVTLRGVGLPPGASFIDHGNGTGTFSWTPAFDQAGSYSLTFVGSSQDGSSNTGATPVAVRNVNRGPTANPGGPYTGTAGAPLQFDGTGSSDPDGTPLSYTWIFGDGATGTGASPSHTYAAAGTYGVALTVADESLSDLKTTTVTVVDLFQARAFTAGGGKTIRLGAGKPTWCVQVEPIGGSFALNLVYPGSIVMKSSGTGSVSEITANFDKTSVGSDRDGNGLEEITACFAKDDLRLLFSNLHGTVTVPVTIEGRLVTGGRFVTAIDVQVHASGGGGATASVAPNPLNPEATLTFHTPTDGAARVRVFGSDGRLLRTLLDESHVSAGYHDVRFDGKDSNGSRLASGVYFYRVETAAGAVGGRIAIVK